LGVIKRYSYFSLISMRQITPNPKPNIEYLRAAIVDGSGTKTAGEVIILPHQ
jgi:hypothetical protein